MRDRQERIDLGEGSPTPRIKRPSELKVAFDCLVYYVGMLAFGQPVGSLETCGRRHYELHRIALTDERLALLHDLQPLLFDGTIGAMDLAELVKYLEAMGWQAAFLKQFAE